MPDGFRGDAVKIYLTKIQDAIDVASEVHLRDPLRGAPVNRTGGPFIPARRNVTISYHPRTAHIGDWQRGIGNSRNIAVDEVRYTEIANQIEHKIESESVAEFERIIRELEELCSTYFVLPQTVYRLRFCLHKLESMFPEYRQLSERYNNTMVDFARKVLGGGSQIVVWNINNAFDVRNENDRIVTNQEDLMTRTIKNCEHAIEILRVRWDERDNVARTAMKTVSDGNGGTMSVPDWHTRDEARLDANEILAQIAGLNSAIRELNVAIGELQRAREDANRFYKNTETTLWGLDRDYEREIRNIGNAIYNFNNKLEQIYNDIGYVFDDSFQSRPDFLNWLFGEYGRVYDWDAILLINGVLNGDVLAALLKQDLTDAEFRSLAELFTNLETQSDMILYLQLLAEKAGTRGEHITWTYDTELINQILAQFAIMELRIISEMESLDHRGLDRLSFEEQEALSSEERVALHQERMRFLDLEDELRRISERKNLFALATSLTYTHERTIRGSNGDPDAIFYTHGPLVGDHNGPTLAFERVADAPDTYGSFVYRLTYVKIREISTYDYVLKSLITSQPTWGAVNVSTSLMGSEIRPTIERATGSVFLPRYQPPDLLTTIVKTLVEKGIGFAPYGVGTTAGILTAAPSAVENWQSDTQMHQDMNRVYQLSANTRIFEDFGLMVQTVQQVGSDDLLIVPQFTVRADRALTELNNIVETGSHATDIYEQFGLQFPITPEVFLDNIDTIHEIFYGPLDNQGASATLDYREVRRVRDAAGMDSRSR